MHVFLYTCVLISNTKFSAQISIQCLPYLEPLELEEARLVAGRELGVRLGAREQGLARRNKVDAAADLVRLAHLELLDEELAAPLRVLLLHLVHRVELVCGRVPPIVQQEDVGLAQLLGHLLDKCKVRIQGCIICKKNPLL